MITANRDYEILYAFEKRLFRRLSKLSSPTQAGRFISPWLFFWMIIGGFFFTVQSYLWLQALALPLQTNTEILAIGAGLVLGTFAGIAILLVAKNAQTNWRIPTYIFLLWMVAPTIFPLLFLIGVFSQHQSLLDLQTSPWRAVGEYLLFGIGLIILAIHYPKITWSQGALTVVLLSFLFIGKSLGSDGFYLAGKCPSIIYNEQLAWFSNTAEEVKVYRHQDEAGRFYHTPTGQFFCTRTREDLFR